MDASRKPGKSFSPFTSTCTACSEQQETCISLGKPLCGLHRLEVDVQLVSYSQSKFADVGVKAALYQLYDTQPNGFCEIFTDVDVNIKDPDHWISLDATTKASHAEAGVGALAMVS
jgi:hypothetical protein